MIEDRKRKRCREDGDGRQMLHIVVKRSLPGSVSRRATPEKKRKGKLWAYGEREEKERGIQYTFLLRTLVRGLILAFISLNLGPSVISFPPVIISLFLSLCPSPF